MSRIVIKDWGFTGGYGYTHKDHAYVYRYEGMKPRPVQLRWMAKGKKGKRKLLSFHKTQHEALERAAAFIF